MHDFSWSAREKKIAHQIFEAAVQAELHEVIVEFKARASAVQDVGAVWQIRDWLDQRQREIDRDFDYRYSQLIVVFAKLVRRGRIDLADLGGLAQDKLEEITFIAEL
jgi:hypothetical protein